MIKLLRHLNQVLKPNHFQLAKGGLRSILWSGAFFVFSFLLTNPLAVAEPYSVRPESSAQMLFEEGLRLREDGRLNKAEWSLKRALEFEPANADYRFELANVYAIQYDRIGKKRVKAGNIQMLEYAARELEQAVMLRPDFVPAIFNLGVVRKKQGRHEEAREAFRDVLEFDPNLVNAHLQIAATYEDQGFFDEAKDSYLIAQEIDYGNLGIRDALEDLKVQRERDRERQLLEQQSRYANRFGGGFQFSPDSRAREYQDIQAQSYQSQQGIQAAIPYLTMWLVDQFMQLRDEE